MSDVSPEDVDVVRQSPFFDAAWYLAQYPDVAAEEFDPARHYAFHGAQEGRNPGPLFDTDDYVRVFPELTFSKINPLIHVARFIEGDFEQEQDRRLIAESVFFDQDWYLKNYPDVARAGIDAAAHYLRYGHVERRDPGPRFSTRVYQFRHPELVETGINPLVHFLRHGFIEGEPVLELPDEASQVSSARISPDTAPGFLAGRRKLGRKAVFVTHDFNIGGAPHLLLSIASWFQRCTDYDVHVVAMANGPLHEKFLRFAPVHIVGHISVADNDVGILRDALHKFLGEEPAFTFVNSAAAGHYCKIDPFQASVLGYVHELTEILAIYQDQFGTLMARAQHVFCGGSGVHEAVLAAYPDRAKALSVRPSFIATPDLTVTLSPADKVERRRQLGWVPDRKVVIGCGVAHWRKQPLVFVRMAARLVIDLKRDLDFVWVGDGEDLPRMRALSVELGLGDRLHLLGHQEEIRTLFAAADVLALTSSEDPFPLVCLEAGATSTPSVVFREATGITSLIEPPGRQPGGAAVPLGDEEAFFAAVDTLVADDAAWARAANAMRLRVGEGYTENAACMELLETIRIVAKLPPRVSVVLPSYNSALYLDARLSSIADQTFRDVEILLLDDASTDESLAILGRFADRHREAELMASRENGGSVFKAWERGINAATGDYVWLAEADDWCEPTFLERALLAFAPSGVRLVHGRSIPTDAAGDIAGDWNDLYLDRIVPDLWRTSFWSPSAKEISRSLGRANTIPNASAVLVQRSAAMEAIKIARSFKLAGDWVFYVAAVHGGRIAYCHEAINFHRRHASSVTTNIEGSELYFRELVDVGAVVRALYGPDEARDAAFHRHICSEADRFGRTAALPVGHVPEDFTPRPPGVMFGVGDLSAGGAQVFAIRFVNRWVASPAPTVLFEAGYQTGHPASRMQVDARVPVVGPEEIEAEGGLSGFLRSYGLDVVASGHWWADKAIGLWKDREAVPAPWVIVMHGCYESVLEHASQFPDHAETFARAERHCAHWVWTAPKNRRIFEEGIVTPRATSQIVNGFEPVRPSGIGRRQLGLPPDALVFTLASRAIAEKGWFAALDAFQDVRRRLAGHRDVRLQLIGDGPAAEAIRLRGPIDGLHQVGHTGHLADYIAASDVCLLPSWFVGESMPLVVIEFLAQGKPAIVSDIGMCPWAVESEAGTAGIVLSREGADGSVTAGALADAMERLAVEPGLLKAMSGRSMLAFRKFDLEEMRGHYARVFESVMANHTEDYRVAAA